MSGYIGVEPIPQGSLILTQGVLSSDSQTISVPGGYAVGNIFVYLDGFRLRQSDFVDTDGLTVDLLEVFPAGTEYIIEEVRNFILPNHYTKSEIQNAEFDFINMPTVGGDPIVASGSNTDGDWTKFVDGTMMCRATGLLSGALSEIRSNRFGTASGDMYFIDVIHTLPLAFLSKNYTAIVNADENSGGVSVWFELTSTASAIAMRVWHYTTASQKQSYTAFGYWK